MAEHSEFRLAVYASIAANVVIAAIKVTAAVLTGSSAMLAEGLHSLADSGDGSLLLLGHRRARRAADAAHPFGYGKELYFWSLIVAVVFFALGGVMSVYQGVVHIVQPRPLEHAAWNYAVLAMAAVVDGASFLVGLHQFRQHKGRRGYLATMLVSKDPTIFTVLLEDTGDLVGITFAFLGVFLTRTLHDPVFDGAASIAVGIVLALIALFLASQSRGLLVGEAADRRLVRGIRGVVETDPAVATLPRLRTMQLGIHAVLAIVELRFHDDLTRADTARAAARLQEVIRGRFPDVTDLFIQDTAQRGSCI